MGEELKVVAILTASEALSALLRMVLSERRDLRVRVFESEAELGLYMHLAPVDLLVCDCDLDAPAELATITRLRAKATPIRPDFQVIALAHKVSVTTRAAADAGGIDEVIVKPMSPLYLTERVSARLARLSGRAPSRAYRGVDRRRPVTARPAASVSAPSNVIPLFGKQKSPETHPTH